MDVYVGRHQRVVAVEFRPFGAVDSRSPWAEATLQEAVGITLGVVCRLNVKRSEGDVENVAADAVGHEPVGIPALAVFLCHRAPCGNGFCGCRHSEHRLLGRSGLAIFRFRRDFHAVATAITLGVVHNGHEFVLFMVHNCEARRRQAPLGDIDTVPARDRLIAHNLIPKSSDMARCVIVAISTPDIMPMAAVEFGRRAVGILVVVVLGEFSAFAVVFLNVAADMELVLDVAQDIGRSVVAHGHGGAVCGVPDAAACLDSGEERADCFGSHLAGFSVD